MQRHRGIILAGFLVSLVIVCVCLIRARSPGPAPAVTGNITRPPATSGSTDTLFNFEGSFIPDIETPGIPSDDEALAAWSKYVGEANKAESAGNCGEAARLWEEYLREYPIGPFAWRAMLRLGWTYEKLGRIDDARRMMYATKELVGEDRMGNTVEINLAQLDRKLGDNRAAEERLRNLMAKPAGGKFDDGWAVSPQLFTAPLELAKICADELRFDEAEELAAGVRARATAIAREHPEADYAFSYAVAACLMQAELLFNKDAGENVEATAEKVRRLADDFRREFPPAPYAGEEGLSREQARKLRGAKYESQHASKEASTA